MQSGKDKISAGASVTPPAAEKQPAAGPHSVIKHEEEEEGEREGGREGGKENSRKES